MPKARLAAQKALALDDSLSEAHGKLGHVLFTYAWGRDEGLREPTRAIPNNQCAQHWYAMAFGGLGRFDEAMAPSPADPLRLALPCAFSAAIGARRPFRKRANQDSLPTG